MPNPRGRPRSYKSDTVGVRKTFYLSGDNAAFLALLADAKQVTESNILNTVIEGLKKRLGPT